MTEQSFILRAATPADAPFIARAVIMAFGDEIALAFAGSADRLPLVDRLFTDLAARDDSQYSYLNAVVAESAADGTVAGVVVAYDGAGLHSLRRAFIAEAALTLGLEFDEKTMDDETSPDEVYLDSLAVFPEFRRRGLAETLIGAAKEKARAAGKPLGLLCDPPNVNARRLYERLGFTFRDQRPFAGTMMDHLQMSE